MLTEYRKLLSPQTVYIPLEDILNKISEPIVKVGEKVYLGQIIAYKVNNSIKTPILSSVSGEVIGFEDRLDRYNQIVNHIIIKNDYLETSNNLLTYQKDISKDIIIKTLKDLGITKLDIDSIFTPINFENKIEHLYVSAVYQNEPFVSTDYRFILENYQAIADGVLLLAKAAQTNSISIIYDKFMPTEALNVLKNELKDSNVNFEEIDARKVQGYDYLLFSKKIKSKPNKNLLKSKIQYVSIETAKVVSDALRKGLGAFTTHLIVTGEGLHHNCEYDVKVGTLFKDIVKDLGGYHDVKTLNVHIGNYLSGIQVKSDDFSITETVSSVHVSEFHIQKENICIKCGECNDVCPVGILPQNIMDAEQRGLSKRILDLHTDECIECGLCTYVCPSKINVLEWVRRAMRRTL